jgi:hypothetical protein
VFARIERGHERLGERVARRSFDESLCVQFHG